MTEIPHRPTFSRQWLGRRFRLTENSITWGSYVINAPDLSVVGANQRDLMELAFREAESSDIASTFADLLHVYSPSSTESFYMEIDALFTYELARQHVSAYRRNGYVTDTYTAARAALWRSFENALSAIFKAAIPAHGLNEAEFVRYRQILHGSHLATFADEQKTYVVAFSQDLVLESIHYDCDWTCVWPKFTPPDYPNSGQ